MNWDTPAAGGDSWGPSATDGAWGTADAGASNELGAESGGDGFNNGGDFGGGAKNVECRNCHQTGHMARDCPEPKKLTGECFNCGEVGHNKADCPNPRVARPFTGTCRICNQEGHPAADCPEKPATVCKNCKREGHRTSDCTESRVDMFGPDVPELPAQDAWEMLHKAGNERDLDEFRIALKAYAKADPLLTFVDVEKDLRDNKSKVYLIAVEKEVPDTMTIVNLQGKIDCKYTVTFAFSPKPRNAKIAERWPNSPEENLARLGDAGFVLDRMIPKCENCGELGHIRKSCKQDPVENASRPEVKCFLCNEPGHRARDCTSERLDPFTCRNYKQPGHKSTDCPDPRSAEGVECKRCGETGHFARDCPNNQGGGGRACQNCGEEGHMAKECTEPRNPATVICRNCDETGHFSKECPKPRDYPRVQCKNCGEMGHTAVRCKSAPAEGDGGFGGDDTLIATESTAAEGGWSNGDATAGGEDSWGDGNLEASNGW